MRSVNVACAGAITLLFCACSLDALDRLAGEPAPLGPDAEPDTARANVPVDSAQDAGLDAGPAPDSNTGDFDDFSRPDGPSLGNNWFCKQPSRWELVGGRARKRPSQGLNGAYRDNLCVRPFSGAELDVEVSAELAFEKMPIDYVQINARVQVGSSEPNWMDGYLLLLDASGNVVHLSRQRGNGFQTNVLGFPLSSAVNTVDVFRMTLRVRGTTAVSLEGRMERRMPEGWVTLGSGSYVDSAADRIDRTGACGFSVDVSDGQTFDNFLVKRL